MNKILKIMFCLIIIWAVIFVINYIRCIELKSPILMKEILVKEVTIHEEEGYVTHELFYEGIGYYIESSIIQENNKIVENKMYLFNKVINETKSTRVKEEK